MKRNLPVGAVSNRKEEVVILAPDISTSNSFTSSRFREIRHFENSHLCPAKDWQQFILPRSFLSPVGSWPESCRVSRYGTQKIDDGVKKCSKFLSNGFVSYDKTPTVTLAGEPPQCEQKKKHVDDIVKA